MSKRNVVIKMTRDQALSKGLLVCNNCGYPPNNHFEFKPRLCAHEPSCPGYQEIARVGKLITRRPSKRRSK